MNNLSAQATKLLESGATKHLNRSFVYSPLRYFFNRFKRNNPKTIEQARQIVKQDIQQIFNQTPNFNENLFLQSEVPTKTGKEFLTRIYNIGINLLKKDLTVRKAFKILTNSTFRSQTYNQILKSIQAATTEFSTKALSAQQVPAQNQTQPQKTQ